MSRWCAKATSFNNGDLNSFLRVVTADAEATLRGLVESGKQRSFGKKMVAPKTMTQRRYVDAIERHDLVFGIGPAGHRQDLSGRRHGAFPRCCPSASAASF